MAESPSLYRRHRPRTFDEVVGQKHVVRTLRNAVDQGKVHHAYLFVGSRGTGKTSMAKILASALNCDEGPRSDFAADDLAVEAIAKGISLDVIEMDAASNNSVDDIRELRDKVGLMPAAGKWKVYILDEAHMLTIQAWNAFLKTLEEPPPNTVFVLATTEANKVPATIVDRCHRFDFHRPSIEDLSIVLRRTAEAESITIDDEAVKMLARSATGSFRDALGTLEQLVTYSGNEVQSDDVRAVLGVADTDLLFRAAEAIADCDVRETLAVVEELAEHGRDIGSFARDLAGHLRQLLVTRTLGEVPETFSLTSDQSLRMTVLAQRISQNRLTYSLDQLSATIGAVREGADPRLSLELALFKAARPDAGEGPESMLARLDALEAQMEGSQANQVSTAQPPQSAPAAAGASSSPTSVESVDSTDAVSHSSANANAERGPSAPAAIAPSVPQAVVVAAAQTAAAPESMPTADSDADPQTRTDDDPSADSSALAAAQAPVDEELALGEIEAAWPAIVEQLGQTNSMLPHVFEQGAVVGLSNGQLTFAFPATAEFMRKKAEHADARRLLIETIAQRTRWRVSLTFITQAIDRPETPGGEVDADALVARLKTAFKATEKAPPRT